jgi:hypothetical protein
VGKLTLAAKLAATSAANKSDSNLEHFGQQSGSNNNLACQQQQQAIDSSIWLVQQKNLKNLKKIVQNLKLKDNFRGILFRKNSFLFSNNYCRKITVGRNDLHLLLEGELTLASPLSGNFLAFFQADFCSAPEQQPIQLHHNSHPKHIQNIHRSSLASIPSNPPLGFLSFVNVNKTVRRNRPLYQIPFNRQSSG